MNRDELLQKIQERLDRMEKWHINTFQCDKDVINRLNPFFGYSNKAKTNNLNSKGVQSVWMGAGAKDITVDVLPNGYGGKKLCLKTDQLTLHQLEGVLDMVDALIMKELAARRQGAMNPNLQELLPSIQRWAEQCAQSAGPQFSAEVRYGKRAVDYYKYYAVVVREEGDQIGSISLKQDKDGRWSYNERTPLGGEWIEDSPLVLKDMFRQIAESMKSITGKSIVSDDTQAKKMLYDWIGQQNKQFAEKGMTFDLDVRYGGETKKETWNLDFKHDFLEDGNIKVKLVGSRPIEEHKPLYVLAEFLINPDKQIYSMDSREKGERARVLAALTDAQVIDGEYANVNGDIEWCEVYMRPFYDNYLKQMNRQYIFSPFDDIRYHKDENLLMDGFEADILQSTVAGISPLVDNCSQEAEVVEHVRYLPQYTFLAQQQAYKAFTPLLDLYNKARQRITDIKVYHPAEDRASIRCKVDGVQQMGKRLPDWKFNELQRVDDKEKALYWLAGWSFRGDLAEERQQGLNKGVGR